MSAVHLSAPVSAAPHGVDLAARNLARPAADVAAEVEGLFVALLIKQMRQTMSGEGFIPGDDSDIVGGLFDQYLGEHIAAAGGLGLARSLTQQLPGGEAAEGAAGLPQRSTFR